MGLELDWLEREERYRRRLVRLLVVAVTLVGVSVLVFAMMRGRAAKAALMAEGQRRVAARDAEMLARKQQFTADSSATANRLAEFIRVHGASPMADLPILMVPLPPGVAAPALAQRVWTEYARVADPTVSAAVESDWYRLYYVDVMNEGPLRGRAVLLPAMRQSGTTLQILKPSFSDITQAQVAVGMRDEIVPAEFDSSLFWTRPSTDSSTDPTSAPTATPDPAPVAPPSAQPKPQPPTPAPPAPTPTPAPADSPPPIELDPIVEPIVDPIIEPDAVVPPPAEPPAAPPDSGLSRQR